ncbi:MAG: glycosyltransferase family 9 protein [Porticoccaceae bacterium]|nr:glycosyltransferase family 9 protein [Porticoccaceae bacterium]
MVLSEQPNDICILRLSAIGDVCHAMSAVQAIQAHYPKAKISWVIGKVEAALLEGLPGVELVIFDKKQGIAAYQKLRKTFKHKKFDVLLHMQVAFRANLAARCIPAKVKVGFDWHMAKEAHSLFINQSVEKQQQPHVLEGFMGFAQAIGVPDAAPQWQLPISDANSAVAVQYLDGLGKTLAIAPAASGTERNWLAERYAEVARHAHNQGFSIVLTGGPTALEQCLADKIMQYADFPVLNLVGKTSLKELLCVLEQVSLVIAPDTGPAHMAVTVGTPVIGLYAHSNPARTGPYLYQDYVVEVYHQNLKQQYGKTADKLPWGQRVKGANLMEQITSESVIAMFDRVVEEQKLG